MDEQKYQELLSKVLLLENQVQMASERIELLEKTQLKNNQEQLVKLGLIDFGLDDQTKLPTRKKDGDCGYDAYCLADTVIPPHSGAKVPLGIGLIIPEPFGVKAETRSGNFINGINVGSAWVDRGYRGQIHALIQNITDEPITIHKGDRPCSIELELTFKMDIVSLDEYCAYYNLDKDEVMDTERGASGYGSTGK